MADNRQDLGGSHEPIYLLSLDGGGVRGISEAVILHEIMTRLQKERGLKTLPKPCDYFHIIGGTSTGGLIAIMLGRLRMSTQEVIDEYMAISSRVFSTRNKRFDQSFRKDELEKAIKEVIARRVNNADARMQDRKQAHKGLCFAVSLRVGGDENTPTIFRSYKRHEAEETTCKIWEAARATTAAPIYFTPAKIKVGKDQEYFIDGAVKWNNPSCHVLREAEARFRSSNHRLGCLVSLGTGLRDGVLKKENQGRRRWFKPTTYGVKELLKLASNSLTDPEPPHREIQGRLKDHPDSYFRFSVPYTPNEERVRIHEHEKMEILRRNTENYLAKPEESLKIDEIVDILCRNRTTGLTLTSASGQASTPETMAEAMDPLLKEREVTSSFFTGRNNVLQKLDAVFERRERGSHPRRDFLLWGIGGIGKTQIALRFIDCFADRFDKVLWIDASDPQMIQHSFQTIAFDVLPHPGMAPHTRPVINWLETTKDEWLLVIDNYDSGKITQYLPNKQKGNILFTSRRRYFEPHLPLTSVVEISEMSVSDSACLFLRACGLDEDDEELQEQARPIVQEVALLPLAIDAAGAHIRMGGQTLDRFLVSLRNEKSQVLARAPPGSEMSANPSVYATFELSLKSIKSYARAFPEQAPVSQSAVQILNTFCFYHSEGVPGEMIVRAAVGFTTSERWRESRVRVEANSGSDAQVFLGIHATSPDERVPDIKCEHLFAGLKLLVLYSLLKQPGEYTRWNIHPLVHGWLRDRMYPGSFDDNLRLSRTILYHSYDMRNAKADRFYRSLLPHMKANSSYQFKGEDTTTFWDKVNMRSAYCGILQRLCHWEEVVPLLQEEYESLMNELDPNDLLTIDAMVNLGVAYMAAGKITPAEDVLRQALDRVPYCPSQDSVKWHYVRICAELSMLSLLGGNFTSAEFYAEKCLKYVESEKINSPPAKSRLCHVYQYIGKWEEALPLAEAVFESRLEYSRQGPTHPETWKAEAEVAYIRARLGDVDFAEKVLARTAQELERELGKEHYDTLVASTNLAWMYFKQHRLGEAEVIQRDVLETGRSALGSEHMYTLYMILRLALTVGESGRLEEAISLLSECERGRRKALWENHPAVAAATSLKNSFTFRMTGYEWAAHASDASLKMCNVLRHFSDFSFTPVQV